MDYFLQNFSDRLVLVGFIVAGTVVAAVVAARIPGAEPVLQRVARVCFAGSSLAAVAATSNGVGGGGGFVWGLGDGGLNQWTSDLARFPDTIQSVLLVGNVVLFLPVGICAAVGWPHRRWTMLAVALCLPVVVETLQVHVLRGVGSTDDVVLNMLGVSVGWLVGGVASLLRSQGSREAA